METHQLDLKATRVIERAVAALLGLTATTSAFDADFRLPPTTFSLPQGVAANTAATRAYLMPQTLCDGDTCRLVNSRSINHVNVASGDVSGFVSNGPTVITEIKGLRMQVLVNGKSQTRLGESQPSIKFSSPVEIQLLRDASPELSNGTTADPIQFWFFTKTASGTNRIDNYIRFSTRLTRIGGSCSIPSRTVELQPVRTGRLTDASATAGERSLQINIDDCPKGYNKILYGLKSVGNTVGTLAGVSPLSVESTAKGVRIRVIGSAGASVVFDTSSRVDAYGRDTGGSFSIPMCVSYVRTEAKAMPDTVNGAMSVLAEYQ